MQTSGSPNNGGISHGGDLVVCRAKRMMWFYCYVFVCTHRYTFVVKVLLHSKWPGLSKLTPRLSGSPLWSKFCLGWYACNGFVPRVHFIAWYCSLPVICQSVERQALASISVSLGVGSCFIVCGKRDIVNNLLAAAVKIINKPRRLCEGTHKSDKYVGDVCLAVSKSGEMPPKCNKFDLSS